MEFLKNKGSWSKSPGEVAVLILGAFFWLWMVMGSFPTGWIYDLWAGAGAKTGQKPDSSVAVLTRQEEVEAFFLDGAPVTAVSGTFITCPLMRLRDLREEGIHNTNRETGNQRIMVTEYLHFNHPMTAVQRLTKPLLFSASYNSYRLVPLSDGTYLCTFFDDYLLIGKGKNKEIKLPAGRIRYTTNEEAKMLKTMSEDYEVNSVYILDLYNHKKISWILDKVLRLLAAFAVTFLYLYITEKIRGKNQRMLR